MVDAFSRQGPVAVCPEDHVSQQGFSLAIDRTSGHVCLACSACADEHEFSQEQSEVVVAAETVTFMAAHLNCRATR